jgi:hypothetical protein
MKISSRTLKIMAAAAGTLSVPTGVWYAADKAIQYDRERQAAIASGALREPEPPVVVQFGQEVLNTCYYLGIRAGLIPRPPCGICGMG